MKRFVVALLVVMPMVCLASVTLYSQPPNGTGALIPSSWVYPDGSDADMYAYESFVLADDADVTEVRWRGGYVYGAMYGVVQNFSIYFFESIAVGTEPHVGHPDVGENIYIARYFVGSNAGETPAGTFGGVPLFDYSYTLPTPVHLTAGVKYWIRIEGYQSTYPDWGLAKATGGNGSYFRFSTGMAMFQFVPGDTSFTLLGDTTSATITPSAVTVGPGSVISGAPTDMNTTNGTSYVLRPGPVLVSSQDPLRMVVSGFAPSATPSILTFIVKATASTFNIVQRVEVYNFQTAAYEQVSFAAPSNVIALVTTITNPTDHVGPGNEVRARLSYRSTGAVLTYPWTASIDEATWRFTP